MASHNVYLQRCYRYFHGTLGGRNALDKEVAPATPAALSACYTYHLSPSISKHAPPSLMPPSSVPVCVPDGLPASDREAETSRIRSETLISENLIIISEVKRTAGPLLAASCHLPRASRR